MNAPASLEDDDLWRHSHIDEEKLSPEFAALHREFCAALREEDAAISAVDGRPAGAARLQGASDKAWEVWKRIDDAEFVYVKDERIRLFPMFWAWTRHGDRVFAEQRDRHAAHHAKVNGRLQ